MRALLVTSTAVALAAAGLAAAASGHSAPARPVAQFALPAHALVPTRKGAGSQTFADRTGDAVNGAPDISGVSVANDDQGNIAISVTLFNHSSDLQPNEGMLVVMDTDGNSNTGNGGFDYIYAGVKDHTGLFVWNGSSFVLTAPATLQSSTVSGQLSFRINRSELGNTTGLNFYVETTRDNGASIGDDAPDGTGVYSYKLILPSAPPPPPPTTPPPPPVPRFVVAAVGTPHPGKRFVVRARVVIGTLSASPSALGCAAKIGTSPLKTAAVNGPAPYRACVITVPIKTGGKMLTVTLLVQYKSRGTTQLTYAIR